MLGLFTPRFGPGGGWLPKWEAIKEPPPPKKSFISGRKDVMWRIGRQNLCGWQLLYILQLQLQLMCITLVPTIMHKYYTQIHLGS